MNRHYLLFVAAVAVAGCMEMEPDTRNKEEAVVSERVLTAHLDGGAETKTLLDPKPEGSGYKVFWSPDDQIYVYADNDDKEHIFNLKSGEGTATAQFVGYGDGAELLAVSPYCRNGVSRAEMLSNGIRLRIPYIQAYYARTADPQMMFMAAKGTDGNLSFKHLMSYLTIPLRGNHMLKSVELHANDGRDVEQFWYHRDEPQYYNRQLDILWDEDGNPSLDVSHEQPSKMYPTMMDCSGLSLDSEEETEITLAVIPQTFYGGFTLTINTMSGSVSKTISTDFKFERGKVHKAGVVDVRLDAEKEPSSSLHGEGTEQNPFLINSAQDLLYFAARANYPGGTIRSADGYDPVLALSACYKQTANIDLSQYCGENIGDWAPIANGDIPFSGIYDGDNHYVLNLYMDKSDVLNAAGEFDETDCAFFGNVSGTVKNLGVYGTFMAYQGNAAIICANKDKTGYFFSCLSSGMATSKWGDVAGITIAADQVELCANIAGVGASIAGDGWTNNAAGIVCFANVVDHCLNQEVVVNYARHQGTASGVVTHASTVINCMNIAQISSTAGAAGISYGARWNDVPAGNEVFIANCVNTGEIVSYSNSTSTAVASAGILGRAIMGGSVMNCLNYGEAKGGGKLRKAGIVGSAERTVNITSCYWFYEAGVGGNTFSLGGGVPCPHLYFSDLTSAQIKGEAASETPLYVSGDNSYGDVMDALNAWAVEHQPQDYTYLQWVRDEDSSVPRIGNAPAVMPGSSDVFQLSKKVFHVVADGATIEMNVVSSVGCQIVSRPDWVQLSSSASTSLSETWTQYNSVFAVEKNNGEGERIGEVVFSDNQGNTIRAEIHQAGQRPIMADWQSRTFVKRSLLAVTCATWCGNCPRLLRMAEQVQDEKPGELEVAVLHSPTSELAFSGTHTVMSTYQQTAIPTGFVNFSDIVYPSGDLAATVTAQQAVGARTGIDIASVVDGQNVRIETRAFLKNAGNYKISVWLLEDGIVGYQSDYVNGSSSSFVHDDTVFNSLTAVLGDGFTAGDGEVVKRFFDVSIPSSRKLDNVRILAIVWTEQSDGSYIVDNCMSAKLGEDIQLSLKD